MFGMSSQDTCFTLIVFAFVVYYAWGKFCEHRWPLGRDVKEDEE